MENLTKENFWNELYEKYPKGMKVFCDWIDEYKKRNNWDSLFPIVTRQHHWAGIKFHHLPLAMQVGIWIEFLDNNFIHEMPVEDLLNYNWKRDIIETIKSFDENE